MRARALPFCTVLALLVFCPIRDAAERPPEPISDVWLHHGPTSAVVSCLTSEKSRVYLEYGAADPRQQVETPNTGGHVHVIRVRGLTEGRSYPARLVAVGDAGEAVRSEEFHLRPRRPDGSIPVPGELTGPPFVLDRPNTTYVLERDIEAEGTAFKITADGVTLELDGHVVSYGGDLNWQYTDLEQKWQGAGHGVHLPGWGATGVRVVNGILREATPKREKNTQGLGHNPVMAEGVTDLELAGLTADYEGIDIRGFWLHNCRAGNVHHCVINDRGTQLTNRHQGLDAIVVPPRCRVHHNLIRRVRHRGINGGNESEIHHNEVHVDSYASNAYGIMFYRSSDAVAHHNYIFGGGYHVIGIGTVSGCKGITVSDNYIELTGTEPTARWPEYGKRSGMNGVRVTWGGEDLVYRDNHIVVTGTGGSQLRGTWFSSGPDLTGLRFEENFVRVVAEEEETKAWAVAVCGDYREPDHPPVLYRGNRIVSNTCNVRLGESYGLGCNARFVGNTFVREGADARYATVRIGYWNKPTTGHVFLDNRFEGGASLDSVRFEASGPRDLTVRWTVTVEVHGPDGRTIPEADVAVADRSGSEVFSGRTDGEGTVRCVLTEYLLEPEGKTYHTPYTVSVTKNGYRPISRTVTADEKRTVRVALTPEGP